jgi:hypothetical protein
MGMGILYCWSRIFAGLFTEPLPSNGYIVHNISSLSCLGFLNGLFASFLVTRIFYVFLCNSKISLFPITQKFQTLSGFIIILLTEISAFDEDIVVSITAQGNEV